MSAQLTRADLLFEQRLLACSGFYTGKLDGLYGPKTRQAEQEAERAYFDLRSNLGALDPRSETLLRGLQIGAQRVLRAWLVSVQAPEPRTVAQAAAAGSGRASAAPAGYTVRIISGTRSYAEQDRLYAQGRTAPGRKVTNARAGASWHNFGLAVDIGLFDAAGRYVKHSTPYLDLGQVSKDVLGLEWGGLFRAFPDPPHYQAATGLDIREARRRFEAGESML